MAGRDAHSEKALERLQPSTKQPTDDQKALVEEARKRVEECANARKEWIRQRDSDREFLESQFSEAQRAYRMRTDRPAVEVHVLWTRVEQILNDWRAADMGVRIGSATSAGGDDAARMFNGLLQRDLRESRSPAIMQQVIEDSITLGEGWGRWAVVRAGGDEVAEAPFDGKDWSLTTALGVDYRELRLKYCPPEEIWPDPHAVEPDRRDMQWLIETRWMTREARDRLFPNAKALDERTFDAGQASDKQWFRETTGGLRRDKMVRVAYYWKKSERSMDYVWLPGWKNAKRADRLTAEDEQAKAAAGLEVIVRKVSVPVVELIVCDGQTVLDGPVLQPMTRIPYFRSVGNEVRYRTGEVVPRGLVSVLRGLSFWMSVMASDVAWKQAVVGLDFWEVTDEAIDGYREQWENMAEPALIRVVNQYEANPAPGEKAREIRPPVYKRAEPNLEANMNVMQQARGLVGMVGGAADQAAREEQGGWRSAMGLNQMEAQAATNRMRWMSNAQTITLAAQGEIYLDMGRFTYSETGRELMIGSETPGDPDEGVMVGVPFVHDPDTGEVIPMPQLPDNARTVPMPVTDPAVAEAAPVTLKVHRFNPRTDRVKVTTFSSGMTRRTRDAKAELLGNLLTQNASGPERAVLVKSALKAMSDVVPMDDVIKQLEALTPDPTVAGDTDVSTVTGRLAQATLRVQELEQQLEQAAQAADQTQAAREIEEMKAQQRAMTAELVSEMKGQFAVAVAEIRAEAQVTAAETEAEGRVEQAMVETAVRSDDARAKLTADATVAGLKAGAKARNDDGGRTPGNAGG